MPHGPLWGGGRTTVAMSTPPTEPELLVRSTARSADGSWRCSWRCSCSDWSPWPLEQAANDNPTEPSLVGPTTTAVAAPTAVPTTVALVTPVVSAPSNPARATGPAMTTATGADNREDKEPKDEPVRRFLRNNGLSITLVSAFLITWLAGQSTSGQRVYNAELEQNGEEPYRPARISGLHTSAKRRPRPGSRSSCRWRSMSC